MPYSAVAGSLASGVMPEAPRAGGPHQQGLGYFASLQSFLTYSFAWTRHDRGLLWWYEAGMPTTDPRFELIKLVWERDGLLDRYLGWFVDRGMWDNGPRAYEPLRQWSRRLDEQRDTLSPEMALRLNRARRAAETDDSSRSPWGMHLEGGDHISAPSQAQTHGDAEPSARIVAARADSRTATFVADRVTGWYSALCDRGAELPPLPAKSSWYVDVFVKPIGFMGTFRRSRETGLWFSGKHQLHAVGN
jgi:hypothetical protein